MPQDFGAGLTIDELIGFRAFDICTLRLPNEPVWHALVKAAKLISERGFEMYVLAELWGDGHSIWQEIEGEGVLVVTPTGQLIPSKTG